MNWRERLTLIAADNMLGGAELVQRTAEALAAFADEPSTRALPEMRQEISSAAREVLATHIANAPVVGLINKALFAASSETDAEPALAALRGTALAYARDMVEHQAALNRRAVAMIPTGATVMIHSYSTTVKRALITAQEIGREPRVICTEARPRFEGRLMAADLAAAGLNVTLIVDSAMHANMTRVEMALAGVDGMSPLGLISNIGTAQMAFTAKARGLPVYGLGDTSKIWPADLGDPLIADHPPAEVWDAAPPGVQVQNRYFDVTPWEALAGVVTERGLMTTDEIRSRSREIPVHAELLNIVAALR